MPDLHTDLAACFPAKALLLSNKDGAGFRNVFTLAI
jgi:hypothetical protein